MSTSGINLARNLRTLREKRGLSQQQMARLSGMPRPTWASLESGMANPTLAVLHKAAAALQVSIEELVGSPRTEVHLLRAGDVPVRTRQGAEIRQLVPESLPGLDATRMEFAPGARMSGVPHTAGTREYLTCERGSVELIIGGEHWLLGPGDMLGFRGDQRHTYHNPSSDTRAVALSLVCFAAR